MHALCLCIHNCVCAGVISKPYTYDQTCFYHAHTHTHLGHVWITDKGFPLLSKLQGSNKKNRLIEPCQRETTPKYNKHRDGSTTTAPLPQLLLSTNHFVSPAAVPLQNVRRACTGSLQQTGLHSEVSLCQ